MVWLWDFDTPDTCELDKTVGMPEAGTYTESKEDLMTDSQINSLSLAKDMIAIAATSLTPDDIFTACLRFAKHQWSTGAYTWWVQQGSNLLPLPSESGAHELDQCREV